MAGNEETMEKKFYISICKLSLIASCSAAPIEAAPDSRGLATDIPTPASYLP